MLDKYFDYKHKTDFKTEAIAGTTTFLTMAYIMFLNPFILSENLLDLKKVSLILRLHCNNFSYSTCMFYNGFYGKTWPID